MSGNMEALIRQAWEEYASQREEAPIALNATLEDLWHKIAQMEAPTPEEEDARLEICADLTERFASLGASIAGTLAAEPHGAFLMGCFNSSSTLEVAVTGKLPAPTAPHSLVDVEIRSSVEKLALLERVHSLIADCGVAAQGTVSINRAARVPSVSFEHASSGIPVRVCIAYPNFALRPQVVRGLALLEPRLRSLIQLVELWADARGLNNPAAGTFNSWALVNLVVFAVQTFQPQPLLPPLWRACGAAEQTAAGASGVGSAGGAAGATTSAGGAAAGSNGGTLMAISALLGASGGGSSSSNGGGAMPLAVRPTQRLPGLMSSSEGTAPVLQDILSRLSGPPEALGLPPSGSGGAASQAGLLPLFHWFLVLLDRLLAHWQLSWNRRWRVSTWWGQLVQQPFNRAFLVPVECPFDPADNAAKSLGCENQSKHQQVLRGVVAEVGATLRLLRATRTPEDLDRLILGVFGLEVEHLYLEEEEEAAEGLQEAVVEAGEQAEGEKEARGSGLQPTQGRQPMEAARAIPDAVDQPTQQQQDGDAPASEQGDCGQHGACNVDGAAGASAATEPSAAAAAAGSCSVPPGCGYGDGGSGFNSPVQRVQQLEAGEPSKPLPPGRSQRAGGSASVTPSSPAEGGGKRSGGRAGKGARRSTATAAAAIAPPPPVTVTIVNDVGVAFDDDAARVEKGMDGVDDGAAAAGAGGSGMQGQAAAESPPLPTSSAAAVTAASPAALRAGAMAHQPLSPRLRDVTNARQYGHRSAQSGPEPKAGTSTATSATESPGGGESLLPFEGLFGSLFEGAKRLFDNMAQGMAELGEDLNELAATTAATIRAVINDDEDLPFLSSTSAALRRQRRQRLQLLHRGGSAPAAAAASPASASGPQQSQARQQRTPGASPGPGASPAGRATQQRQPCASPLRPGEHGAVAVATPAGRAAAAASSPARKAVSPVKAAAALAVPCAAAGAAAQARPAAVAVASSAPTQMPPRVAKRRGEEIAAALTAAVAESSLLPSRKLKDAALTANSDNGSHKMGLAEEPAELLRPDPALEAPTAPKVAGLSSGGDMATVAAATAGGPLLQLNTMPVGASEHPLACCPLPIAEPTVTTQKAAADASQQPPPVPIATEEAGSVPVVTLFAGVADAPAPGPLPEPSEVPPGQLAEAAAPAAVAAVPLEVGLLRLVSLSGGGGAAADGTSGCGGGASTCGTCLTRASTPTADAATASTASSPTVASSRSFAPTPTRKSNVNGERQSFIPGSSAASAILGSRSAGPAAAPPPPPLPPPPRPPAGMGGLRVKSATFRKGVARDPFLSPTGAASSTGSSPTAAAATTTAITTAALSPATSLVQSLSSSVAASAAAFSCGPIAVASAATAAAEAAEAALLQDPAARTVLRLSSGRLQELAECIDRAGPRTTLDLQGGSFSGPLAAPAMKVTAPGLWLTNGELALSPEQQLVVVAKGARLTDVTVRDLPVAVAAPSMAATAGGGTSAAARPALLVTKQSYAGGGELALARCRLLLGASRGVGVQVKGKGCSASLEACLLRGCCLAAVQASDAALTLTGSTLECGGGQGVCCRDNGAVTVADCTLRRFGGPCAAVLAGGSLELAACRLTGGAGGAEDADGGGDEQEQSPLQAVACGPGVLAEGKGSSLVARGSFLSGFRSQAVLVVTAGAAVSLEDCRATDSGQGAVVGIRGGRLLAARCELSGHSSHGLAIGEGATADLRDCRLRHNGAAGLRVGGVGSMAVLRGCELSDNAGSGIVVAAGGCANLDGCTAAANGGGATAAAACPDDRRAGAEGGQPQSQQSQSQQQGNGAGVADGSSLERGHGLHVEGGGARVTALRCGFSGNAGPGVRVGAHGSVQLMGCGMQGNGRGSSCGSCVGGGSAQQGRQGAGAVEEEEPDVGVQVEVEVEAHGRLTMSKGCSWGGVAARSSGSEGRSGSGEVAEERAAGGLGRSLRVAELGCLELLADG